MATNRKTFRCDFLKQPTFCNVICEGTMGDCPKGRNSGIITPQCWRIKKAVE